VRRRRHLAWLPLGIALLASWDSPVAAGPWNRPRKGYYAKWAYNHLRAEELATLAGDVVPIPAFTKDEATLYAEYGVTGSVTAILDLIGYVRGVQPWDTTPGDASTVSPAGFGDGVTYLAYGPGLIVEVARGVALQLDVDGATNVRNIAKGPTVRFGLSVSR
jgi:hypothetical protein